MLWWVLLGLVVVAVLVVADRALLAAERRGWIYYRTRRPSKGAAAERMVQLGTIWDPSQAHHLQEKDRQEDDADEDAEPSDD